MVSKKEGIEVENCMNGIYDLLDKLKGNKIPYTVIRCCFITVMTRLLANFHENKDDALRDFAQAFDSIWDDMHKITKLEKENGE